MLKFLLSVVARRTLWLYTYVYLCVLEADLNSAKKNKKYNKIDTCRI